MATRTLTGCQIYWDTQDQNNEGWAYHVYYSGGHNDSGSWDRDLPRGADRTELSDAVVDLADLHNAVISADAVDVGPDIGGDYWFGYAEWSADAVDVGPDIDDDYWFDYASE